MSKLFLTLIVVFVILTGCQQQAATPVTLQASEDEMNLRELLVYPEELGWSNAYYTEKKGYYYVHSDLHQVDVISISSRPFSNSSRYIDPRVMEQQVHIYENEIIAKEAYIIGSEYPIIPQVTLPSEKIIDAVTAGCRIDPENRLNLMCNVVMSYGRYYVHGFMYVDDDRITLEHWDTYMNLMQEKLFERVERDSSP